MGTAAVGQDVLSLLALRERAIRFWLAAVGIVAFGTAYAGPIALSFQLPSFSTPVVLPALELQAIGFPTLAVPKLQAAPKVPPLQLRARTAHQGVARQPVAASPASARPAAAQRTRTVKVPVAKNDYSLAPPAAAKAPAKQHDAFAGAPVVEDTVGAAPPVTDAAVATSASDAPTLPEDQAPVPVQASATANDLPDYAQQPSAYADPVPATPQDATTATTSRGRPGVERAGRRRRNSAGGGACRHAGAGERGRDGRRRCREPRFRDSGRAIHGGRCRRARRERRDVDDDAGFRRDVDHERPAGDHDPAARARHASELDRQRAGCRRSRDLRRHDRHGRRGHDRRRRHDEAAERAARTGSRSSVAPEPTRSPSVRPPRPSL